MDAMDPAAPGLAALIGALLGAAAVGSFAADNVSTGDARKAAEKAAVSEGHRDMAAMMKECLAREQKKTGTDRAAAEASCRGQMEAQRASGTSPQGKQSPASGERPTDSVPLAPTAEGKPAPSK